MKLHRLSFVALAAALLLPAATALGGQQSAADAKVISYQKVFYPLDVCAVSGQPAAEGEELLDVLYNGRLVRFCCTDCAAKLENPEEAAKIIGKLDAAVIAEQTPLYPLTDCAVSGEKLGSMGAPIDVVVDNRLVRLCCKGCKKALAKDPAKVMADVDAAIIAHGRQTSAIKNCLVSGEDLGSMGDPVERIYGVQYVSFCCKGCVKKFEKEPAKYLAKVPAPEKAKAPADKG